MCVLMCVHEIVYDIAAPNTAKGQDKDKAKVCFGSTGRSSPAKRNGFEKILVPRLLSARQELWPVHMAFFDGSQSP